MSEKNINNVFLNARKEYLSEETNNQDRKKKRAFLVLDICSTIWTFHVLSILKGKTGKEKYLLLYVLFTILTYYIARLTGILNLMNIFHVLLAIAMVITPLISENKDILILLISSSLSITASRKIFGGCIVRDIEKKDSEITDNSFTKMLKWDYIFPGLGLIGLYKLNRIM